MTAEELLAKRWREMSDQTDGWNWYWLSYGEKCYAFAVVTAFPLDERMPNPPAGGMLEPHEEKDRVWVAENGTEMLVDEHIANIERQNGDVICRFIAQSFATAQAAFEPGFCEHGIIVGDWCEECNAAYKAARRENGDD